MFLRLTGERWQIWLPWSDDPSLFSAAIAFGEETTGWNRPSLWDTASSPSLSLRFPDTDALPALTVPSLDEALPWPIIVQPWSQDQGVLPALSSDESLSWVVDDAQWQTPLPWTETSLRQPWDVTEDVPPSALPALEESGWQPALPWAAMPASLAWGRDEEAPGVAPAPMVTEDAWQPPPCWSPDCLVWSFWVDEQILPPLAIALDEETIFRWSSWPQDQPGWQPWQADDGGIPGIAGDDEGWWLFTPPWAMPVWRPLWTGDDDLPGASILFLDEDWWLPRPPWAPWPWVAPIIGEEEFPTPAVPLFLDEDWWAPRSPWAPWPFPPQWPGEDELFTLVRDIQEFTPGRLTPEQIARLRGRLPERPGSTPLATDASSAFLSSAGTVLAPSMPTPAVAVSPELRARITDAMQAHMRAGSAADTMRMLTPQEQEMMLWLLLIVDDL